MRRGDIVLLGRPFTHVGFLSEGNPFGMIHVPTNGACVEVRFDPGIHRLRAAYRPLTADPGSAGPGSAGGYAEARGSAEASG